MCEIEKIPQALYGACFHGEVWIRCPFCQEGLETMGAKEEYCNAKFRFYKCKKCGKLFKDRISY